MLIKCSGCHGTGCEACGLAGWKDSGEAPWWAIPADYARVPCKEESNPKQAPRAMPRPTRPGYLDEDYGGGRRHNKRPG